MRLLFLGILLIANPAFLWSQGTPEIKFSDNMPTKNGFSAELRLTDDKTIFQEIDPNPQHLVPLKEVKRGVPFYTVILFANAASKDGKPDLTYAIIIKRPDGTTYGLAKDIPGWKNRPPAVPGLVHIAAGTLTIKIDPEDPVGEYAVIAAIRDNARATIIQSEQSFEVK
jgi:hypothetical protein